MIDPHDVTNFEGTDYQLEEFMLFAPAVAGKTAVQISAALDRFLKSASTYVPIGTHWMEHTPFQILTYLVDEQKNTGNDVMSGLIRQSRLGQHTKLRMVYGLFAEFYRSKKLDLRTCTAEDLEKIPFIGFKTSRFFILHTRRNANCVPIDTHWLKRLRDEGLISESEMKVPGGKTSAAKQKYKRLENMARSVAIKNGQTLAECDLENWCRYTKTEQIQQSA